MVHSHGSKLTGIPKWLESGVFRDDCISLKSNIFIELSKADNGNLVYNFISCNLNHSGFTKIKHNRRQRCLHLFDTKEA